MEGVLSFREKRRDIREVFLECVNFFESIPLVDLEIDEELSSAFIAYELF